MWSPKCIGSVGHMQKIGLMNATCQPENRDISACSRTTAELSSALWPFSTAITKLSSRLTVCLGNCLQTNTRIAQPREKVRRQTATAQSIPAVDGSLSLIVVHVRMEEEEGNTESWRKFSICSSLLSSTVTFQRKPSEEAIAPN